MATVLACGACHYPMSFRDIAPDRIAETEKTVYCTKCGAVYNILIRMTHAPDIMNGKLEEVKNRPSA